MREIIEEIAENDVSLLDAVLPKEGESFVPVTDDKTYKPKPKRYDVSQIQVRVEAERRCRTDVQGEEALPVKQVAYKSDVFGVSNNIVHLTKNKKTNVVTLKRKTVEPTLTEAWSKIQNPQQPWAIQD